MAQLLVLYSTWDMKDVHSGPLSTHAVFRSLVKKVAGASLTKNDLAQGFTADSVKKSLELAYSQTAGRGLLEYRVHRQVK